MTLSSVTSAAENGVEHADSFADFLHCSHSTLDAKCTDLWIELLPRLSTVPSGFVETSEYGQTTTILQKVLHNYSHIHQLQRLFKKLVEALHVLDSTNTVPRFISTPLYCGLVDVLQSCSEQQVANVLELISKEIQSVGVSASTASSSKLRCLSELLWIILKNISVKSTTRPEIIQNLCRIWLDIQTSILRPLYEATKSILSPNLLYLCLVTLHGCLDFPVVVKDRCVVPESSLKDFVKNSLPVLCGLATSVDAGGSSIYWLQKICLLQISAKTKISSRSQYLLAAAFPWDVLASTGAKVVWDQNPFSVTCSNLPVAIWNGIIGSYCYIEESVVQNFHGKFADFLIRSLFPTEHRLSKQHRISDESGISIYSSSQSFVDSGLLDTFSSLRGQLGRQVESHLRTFLEGSLEPSAKRLKKKGQKTINKEYNANFLTTVLDFLAQLDIASGSTSTECFSLSLLWKSLEYILVNKQGWDDDSATSVIRVVVSTLNIFIALDSKDAKYWLNLLLDLQRLRPNIQKSSVNFSRDDRVLLSYETYMALKYLDCNPEFHSLATVLTQNGYNSFGDADTTRLSIVFLQALIQRLHRPKAIFSAHESISTLCLAYASLSRKCFADPNTIGSNDDGLLLALLGSTIEKCITALTKIDSSTTRMQQTKELIVKAVAAVGLKTVLALVTVGDYTSDRMAVLVHVTMHLHFGGVCRPKTVRQILGLFSSPVKTDEAVSHLTTEFDTSSETTDAELFRMLCQKAGSLKLTVPPFANADHVDNLALSSKEISIWQNCFMEIFAKCDNYPKLCEIFCETAENLAKQTTAIGRLRELMLCRTLNGCAVGQDTVKEFSPLQELIISRLCVLSATTISFALTKELVSLLAELLTTTENFAPDVLEISRIALSGNVFRNLLLKTLTDSEFASLFDQCTQILNRVVDQPRLIGTQTVHLFVSSASLWLTSLMRRSRQEQRVVERKSQLIRLASFVTRLFGKMAKYERFFSKLVIHLIATYCDELQHGALYPEVKEHVVSGLYRLLDFADFHTKSMINAMIAVELRETFRVLVEDHMKFHRYQGLV